MRRQSGTTLLVVLIMLVVLTLLAISGMRMGTSSLQIVGNMQARRFVDNVASQAMEDVMNSIVPFNAPTGPVNLRTGGATLAANANTWTSLTTPAGMDVRISTRTCLFSAPASGYSAVSTIAPEDNLWQFTVDVRDTFTKASTSMVQGAKIRQLFGACP
jgi:type II secretory pathway pseudopilin PulG